MYTVIEIENRKLKSSHDVYSQTEAIGLMNRLMQKYLDTFGLTTEDIDPEDIACATEDHIGAFVDVSGSNWDTYAINHN